MLGVIAVAELTIPSSVAADEEPPSQPIVTSEPEPGAPSVALPESPPQSIGGVVELTGDREAIIDLGPNMGAFGFPSEDSRFQLVARDERLIFGVDDDGAPFIDQAALGKLNFFLDSGDCGFNEIERNLEAGLVRLDIACPEIVDVHQTETVTVDGFVDVPLTIGVTGDEFASGGALALAGGLTAELAIPSVTWFDYVDRSCADCQPVSEVDQVYVGKPESETQWDLELGPGAGDPLVTRLLYQPFEFIPGPDSCAITQTLVGRVAPDIELIEMGVGCAELADTTGEVTVSVSGTVRVHKVTVVLEFG